RHDEPVIADRICASAGRPLAAVDDEAVGQLFCSDAERPEAGDERRDAVALLDAQLVRAGDLQLTAERGPRRQDRQLVDEAWHLVSADRGGLIRFVTDTDRPH